MLKGKLITLEGIDGAGKSTQVVNLSEYLTREGYEVVRVREPGGTQVGELVRDILLKVDSHPLTELMLFTASRMELIHKVILPALEAGKVVISDRFTDSTIAYQGYGRGLVKEARILVDMVHNIVQPDYTLFFDIPFELSIERVNNRGLLQGKDRLDSLDVETKRIIYNGYKVQAELKSDITTVINGKYSIEETQNIVQKWVDFYFTPDNFKLKKVINA